MTDFLSPEELKKEMLLEALEYYIYRLEKDKCNQAAIDAFTRLLEQVENEIPRY